MSEKTLMPEKFFALLKSKINKIRTTAFLSALFCGIAAHFYRITNWLPNWDSLVFRSDPQHMEPLGRWFLSFASSLSTGYELPWLNGILALIFVALASVFVCETLDVKKRASAAMIGGMTAVFPTVISTFTYCYVVDAYCLSFLFVCIACFLLTRKKGVLNTVAAVVLMTLSLGIYQAYIMVAVALLTCVLILGLVTKADSHLCSLKKLAKYALCVVAAVLCYYLIWQAVMALGHMSPSDYQGISQTTELKNFSLSFAVSASLYYFYKFFVDFSTGINVYSIVNLAIFAAVGAGYVALAAKKVRGWALPLLIAYVISVPFGCSAIYFAKSSLDYHTLMKMSFFVVYIYLIMLYEKLEFKIQPLNAVKCWAIVGLCAVMIYSNICTANVAYHKLQMAFEKSYGILVRISDRIELLDGFDRAERILVIGRLENSDDYSIDFPPEITGTTNGLIVRHDDEVVGQSVMTSALNDYCDLSLDFVSGTEAQKIESRPQIAAMPCWPNEGSVVKTEDGIIVVKLSEPLVGKTETMSDGTAE